jgi:polygalacturonase
MKQLSGVLLGLTALAGAALPVLMPVAASADQLTVYVSHHAAATNADASCATAKFTTINGAIHDVAAGGRVIVCPGTYRTQAPARVSTASSSRSATTSR